MNDAKHVALLLTELGYPSTEVDVQERLDHALNNDASCCLVAQSAGDVIGLIIAELVPLFSKWLNDLQSYGSCRLAASPRPRSR